MDMMFAFIDGVIWSAMWITILIIMMKIYPKSIVHNYPKNIQNMAIVPNIKNKTLYYILMIIFWIVIIGYLIYSGVSHYHYKVSPIWTLMLHTFIVTMVWNVIDLLFMDFLCMCTITPKFIVLQGTEGNKDYKNYLFHLKGFIKGSIYCIISAIVFGSINFFILKVFIWK